MEHIWRFVNRLAWRFDPHGALMAPWEPRGILWRLSDGLHRAAFRGRYARHGGRKR